MGTNIGIPASIVCITRQLEAIAAARHIHFTAKDRRRYRLVDLALGLGFPIFTMATHIIYQGHRFDVTQRVGCYPTIYWSWPALFMYEIWPVIFGLVAAGYASKQSFKQTKRLSKQFRSRGLTILSCF